MKLDKAKLKEYLESLQNQKVFLNKQSLSEQIRQFTMENGLAFIKNDVNLLDNPQINQILYQVYKSIEETLKKQIYFNEFVEYWISADSQIEIILQTRKQTEQTHSQHENEYQQSLINNPQVKNQTNQQKQIENQCATQQEVIIKKQKKKDKENQNCHKAQFQQSKKYMIPQIHEDQPIYQMVGNEIHKHRLNMLFELYIKKQFNQQISSTFEEINRKLKSMNLNVWMKFNRDFKILPTLSIDQVHNVFKKVSQNRTLVFQNFYVGVLQVLSKYKNKTKIEQQQAWKILSINNQQVLHKKIKQIACPALIEHKNDKKSLPKIVFNKRVDKTETKQNHQLKQNLENLDLDKLSHLKLSPKLKIQPEQQDNVYLKEFLIEKSKPVKYVEKFINAQKLERQGSEGLLNRLDERIKKYTNKN